MGLCMYSFSRNSNLKINLSGFRSSKTYSSPLKVYATDLDSMVDRKESKINTAGLEILSGDYISCNAVRMSTNQLDIQVCYSGKCSLKAASLKGAN